MKTIEDLKKLMTLCLSLSFNSRNAHWNIQSPNFKELHELFGSLYERADKDTDDLAERIRQLGLFVQLPDFETPDVILSEPLAAIKQLMDDNQLIIDALKDAIKSTTDDPATNNLLMNMVQKAEKDQWMLRSHLN